MGFSTPTSRMNRIFTLATITAIFTGCLAAQDIRLASGDASMVLHQTLSDGGYSLTFEQAGRTMRTYAPEKPLSLEVNGERIDGGYANVSQENGTLVCQGVIISKHGTQFFFTDRFLAEKPGSFELRRNIAIQNENSEDQYFNSLFGIEADTNSSLQGHDFFVPGIWYKINFQTRMAGALAKNPADHFFFFREDRPGRSS